MRWLFGALLLLSTTVAAEGLQLRLETELWSIRDEFSQRPKVQPYVTENDRIVIVNIPDFTLRYYEHGILMMESKVILGREDRQTPEMEDEITHVILNPYWNLSERLAGVDILPKYANNKAEFVRRGYEIVKGWDLNPEVLDPYEVDFTKCIRKRRCPWRVRQKPGPYNTLGQAKILFPNQYNVYIHDTPSKHLFAKKIRTYSSGCIRVEHPLKLVAHLTGVSVPELERRIGTGERQEIYIPDAIPVVVLKEFNPGSYLVYKERKLFSGP